MSFAYGSLSVLDTAPRPNAEGWSRAAGSLLWACALTSSCFICGDSLGGVNANGSPGTSGIIGGTSAMKPSALSRPLVEKTSPIKEDDADDVSCG